MFVLGPKPNPETELLEEPEPAFYQAMLVVLVKGKGKKMASAAPTLYPKVGKVEGCEFVSGL